MTQGLLKAIGMANPFVWWAIGVGSLIAVLVYLYRNWDKVKASVSIIGMEFDKGVW